jgi:SAM-dependent methyltransferase
MLGRSTASVDGGARPAQILRRAWGVFDLHARQKWGALWPLLEELPTRPLRLLDAGCAAGMWSLEIAKRRPLWDVTGIDIAARQVARAEEMRRALNVPNARFTASNFLDFSPDAPFDVVLSVMSAHYLLYDGWGARLFCRFRDWLRPGGRLLLLVPRRRREVPRSAWLPFPEWWTVAGREELVAACGEAGLTIESLEGRIGVVGTFAKQLDWGAKRSGSRIVASAVYPVGILLSALDRQLPAPDKQSSIWLLTARAPERGEELEA